MGFVRPYLAQYLHIIHLLIGRENNSPMLDLYKIENFPLGCEYADEEYRKRNQSCNNHWDVRSG